MPFLEDPEPAGLIAPPDQGPETTATPSFRNIMGAAMARENTVGSFAERLVSGPRSAPSPGFDPWSNVTGYEDYASSFSDANSEEDVIRIKSRIDKERQRADLLHSGGAMGVMAEIAAGIADPVNLIPVGGEIIQVGRTGARALRAARSVGTAAALSGVATEAALQATQDTRTWMESGVNVAAQALLGGILGGAIGTVVGRDISALSRGAMLDTETIARDMEANLPNSGGNRSADIKERENIAAQKKAIADDVKAQLVGAGRSEQEANAAGVLISSHIEARAARLRITPAELYRSERALIETGELDEVAEMRLYQPPEEVVSTGPDGRTNRFDRHMRWWTGGVDALLKSDASDERSLGRVFYVLKEFGHETGPVKIRPRVAQKIALDHPDVPREVWDRLPEMISDPLYVFRHSDGGVNVVVDARTSKGEPIIVGIRDGQIRTITPSHDREGFTGNDRIQNLISSALERREKVYLRDGETPAEAVRALREQSPAPAAEAAASHRSKGNIISREDVIKNQQRVFYEGGQLLEQGGVLGPRGSITMQDGETVIRLFKDADASTFFHETGHQWLEELLRDAADSRALQGVRDDAAVVRNWLGAPEGQALTREQHERFARGFERYLMEGDAPTPELESVFDQFKQWLVKIYETVLNLNAPINDDIRKVFDRLVAVERQNIGEGGSLSAAAASPRTLGSEGIAGLGKVPEALAFSAPTLRTQTSPVLPTRLLAQELAEQPLMTKGNLEGLPSPIAAESMIRQHQYPLAKALNEVDDIFVQYRLGKEKKTGDLVAIGLKDLIRNDEKLSRDRFMEAVGYAMRRGDESDIPEVAQAARVMRKTVFDPLKDRAVELGLLEADVDPGTATSYLMRQYNYGKIAAERNRFTDIVTDWYAEQQEKKAGIQRRLRPLLAEKRALEDEAKALSSQRSPDQMRVAMNEGRSRDLAQRLESIVLEWEGKSTRSARGAVERRDAKEAQRGSEGRLREADREIFDAADRIAHSNTALSRSELADVARQTIDRILGTPAGRLAYDVRTPAPGFMMRDETPDLRAKALKGRVFMIPDNLIEDFLESDVTQIARAYVRTMAPDVTLAERGWLDFDEKIKPILEAYQKLRDRTEDPKELTKLNDRMNADIRDVKAIYERLRGTYALPQDPNSLMTRGFRVIRDLNYLRLMGGMTISALPDVGRSVMQHGFTRVFRDGFVPMVDNLKTFRLAADEVKLAGEALDMVLDTRSMSIADVMEDYGRHTKFERGLLAATGKFGMVSLMAPWNAALKQFVGVVSQTRSLQAIEALLNGNISNAERARLAQFGIGEDAALRIGREFQRHGQRVGNLWWANTEAWTDSGAREAYRAALSKEINQVIVTPGQEKPLWMSTEFGKVIGQFKSFSVASMQRVTLAGIQKRDMATLNGAAMMIGLGALVYYLKTDHDRLDKANTGTWVKEGIDRSGLTGWMFEVNNIMEKMTRGAFGASRAVGGPMSSRYASRGVLESILGPTAGLVNDVAQITGSAATMDWREADSRAVRRMLPLQNLLGFKYAVDAAEQGLNSALGTALP